MTSGILTSVLIIAACFAGVVWAGRVRATEMRAERRAYLTPLRLALFSFVGLGFIALLAFQAWVGSIPPEPLWTPP